MFAFLHAILQNITEISNLLTKTITFTQLETKLLSKKYQIILKAWQKAKEVIYYFLLFLFVTFILLSEKRYINLYLNFIIGLIIIIIFVYINKHVKQGKTIYDVLKKTAKVKIILFELLELIYSLMIVYLFSSWVVYVFYDSLNDKGYPQGLKYFILCSIFIIYFATINGILLQRLAEFRAFLGYEKRYNNKFFIRDLDNQKEKWYLYHLIDENYILVGNTEDPKEAERFQIIPKDKLLCRNIEVEKSKLK